MKYIIFNLSDFVPCPGNVPYVKVDTPVRKSNRLTSKFCLRVAQCVSNLQLTQLYR